MRHIISFIIIPAALSLVHAAEPLHAETKSGDCKVVERNADGNSQALSSSVTAGGGRVTGSTTGSGNSITVHSGDGKSSASVATAGSSGGSSVVAGSGSGDCTIYVNPGEKKP